MATAQTAKNGVAKKASTEKTTASKTVKTPAETAVIEMADDNLKKMVTFQQTVDRLNDLKKMSDNYSKITETLAALKVFKGASAESIQFTLTHCTDDEHFTTYNSTLINMVVDILTTKLQEKQFELVDKILAFKL